MTPIYIHNSAYTQNVNMFTAIGPTIANSTFRIYIALGTSGVVSVQRTNAAGGGGTVVEQLNAGTALAINAAYIFDIPCVIGDTISLQSAGATGTILTLIVREI